MMAHGHFMIKINGHRPCNKKFLLTNNGLGPCVRRVVISVKVELSVALGHIIKQLWTLSIQTKIFKSTPRICFHNCTAFAWCSIYKSCRTNTFFHRPHVCLCRILTPKFHNWDFFFSFCFLEPIHHTFAAWRKNVSVLFLWLNNSDISFVDTNKNCNHLILGINLFLRLFLMFVVKIYVSFD